MMGSLSAAVSLKIKECFLVFPTFDLSSAQSLSVVSKIFTKHLSDQGFTPEMAEFAFDRWIASGTKFPTVADIIAAGSPKRLFAFDSGPRGACGYYPISHPYVQRQIQIGVDISAHEVILSAGDAIAWLDHDDMVFLHDHDEEATGISERHRPAALGAGR